MLRYTIGVKIMNFVVLLYALIPPSIEKKYEKIALQNRTFFLLYITNIGLYLTIISVGLGLISHFRRRKGGKVSLCHYYFTVNTLGIESIVTIGYWLLYFINPLYVNNRELYKAGYRVSLSREILCHIFPFMAIFFEIIFLKLKREYVYYVTMISFSIVYYLISDINAYKNNGNWQYGFLTMLPTSKRILAFVAFTFLGICIIELTIFLQRVFKNKINGL
ncbi:hypothetical protein TUBRATIS_27960 [Tubulinosema ratisbonensis]|uniref:FAR-17a/AIG1-like protein n=1 Tax=Tubulinosema ratisbonensis TaxID=291195 RepID=A0A437AHY9_9MICR|nr:hypothetical protein TUBRATIS_27960 [Tubulinosema ratisbonensis]